MNRYQWTFLDEEGGKHLIRLFHGPRSGHLLLLCDSTIVAIDFKVFKDSTYTFFIDEELCEASIRCRDGHYIYDFRINNQLDTPLNLKRRKEERRHLLLGLGLVVAVVVFAILVGTGLQSMNNRHIPSLTLAGRGVETPAVLFTRPGSDEVRYAFLADSRAYHFSSTLSELTGQDSANALPALGMPLKNGDEFMLRYIPQNPKRHRLFLDRPSPYQLSLYRDRALAKHLALHPGIDSAQADCQLEQAEYYIKENAIPLFYYQDKPVSTTAPFHRYNKINFDSLFSYPPFRQSVNGFCDD